MKNKIIVKSHNILSFDEQVKNTKNIPSIAPFMQEYFKTKITPSRYLYLTKQYKE
jgi:hypothetical protein|uniref:Uncharacterized protein n=1 Tax=viral metagenome TaxID=1070528 RepID=A0A6C0D137_9ZZZZ